MPTRKILAAAVLLCGWAGSARAAKTSQPALKIPLDALGYLPPPPHGLTANGTMFTLNYVDAAHLLVTFNSRGLLVRDPNDPPGDEDRSVTALLLELPSGTVLAKTIWRTHDHGQYLWPLTHGRFLLRIRGDLSVIAPIAHLALSDPFRAQPYLTTKLQIGFLAVSPEGELLTVETHPRRSSQLATSTANAAALNAVNMTGGPLTKPALQGALAPEPAEDDVSIAFYRLRLVPDGSDITGNLPPPIHAGAVRYHALINPAITSEGYLETPRESTHTWLFDFYTHGGVKHELAPFDTTCMPSAYFVSRSEFIGVGCRGGSERNMLGGFNMKGEQTWRQDVVSGVQQLYLARAPEAGRFAISRLLMDSPSADLGLSTVGESVPQEITVTQTWTGDNLLKLQTTPPQGAGQNFDLSPDGMALALLREATIEIYRLPEPSARDRAAIAEAKRLSPPPESAMVRLNHGPVVEQPAQPPAAVEENGPVRVKTQRDIDRLEVGGTSTTPAPSSEAGDTPRRTPPTLYGPGEAPAPK